MARLNAHEGLFRILEGMEASALAPLEVGPRVFDFAELVQRRLRDTLLKEMSFSGGITGYDRVCEAVLEERRLAVQYDDVYATVAAPVGAAPDELIGLIVRVDVFMEHE